MESADYPRPNEPVGQPYPADANWATWMAIVSGVGLFSHTPHAIGLSQSALSPATRISAAELAVLSLLRLVGAFYVFGSRRRGFTWVTIASSLYALNAAFGLFLGSQPVLLIGLVANVWFVQYCINRLMGRYGSRPL